MYKTTVDWVGSLTYSTPSPYIRSSPSPPPFPTPPNGLPMDSFNDANGAGFYTTTDSGEFYGYLIKTSVPGWVEVEVPETPPCGWGLGGWPDCVGDSQTGLGGVAGSTQHHYNPLMNRGPPYISPESMPLVTSCGAQTQCSNYPFSPEVHQSTEGWDAQSSPFGAVDWEGYLANAVESGVSAVAPVPNNRKPFFLWRLKDIILTSHY